MGRSNRFYTPKKTADYEKAIRNAIIADCIDRGIALVKFPKGVGVNLDIEFYYSTKDKKLQGTVKTSRPDLDNLVKAIKDACNALLWDDDSQVTDLHACKRWHPADSGIVFTVSEL